MDGKRHREDGPAIEDANGTKHWYKNGERKSEVFHQNKLIKLVETGGLYK